MSENLIKPGTRCECRDEKCGIDGKGRIDNAVSHARQCTRDAVRMVTVRVKTKAISTSGTGPGHEVDYEYEKQAPLCAACADWHENGASK